MITKEKAAEIVLNQIKQHLSCNVTDNVNSLSDAVYILPEYANCWFVIPNYEKYKYMVGGSHE